MNCSRLPRRYRFRGCEARSPIALALLGCAGPDSADGVPDRAVDWYEVAGVG